MKKIALFQVISIAWELLILDSNNLVLFTRLRNKRQLKKIQALMGEYRTFGNSFCVNRINFNLNEKRAHVLWSFICSFDMSPSFFSFLAVI